MAIHIPLTAEVEGKLRARAEVLRKEPGALAAELVERGVTRSALDELLAPLRAQFEASGIRDEALVEQIMEARDAHRDKR